MVSEAGPLGSFDARREASISPVVHNLLVVCLPGLVETIVKHTQRLVVRRHLLIPKVHRGTFFCVRMGVLADRQLLVLMTLLPR